MQFYSESLDAVVRLERTPLLISEARRRNPRSSSVGYAAQRSGAGQFSRGREQHGTVGIGGGYGLDPYYMRLLGHGKREYERTAKGAAQKAKASLIRMVAVKPPKPHYYGG